MLLPGRNPRLRNWTGLQRGVIDVAPMAVLSGFRGRNARAATGRGRLTMVGSEVAVVTFFEQLFGRLNADGVRYVVVGGLAVVLHGHPRMTADVDLVVDLAPEEARRAIRSLVGLGLRPRVPVNPEDFADATERARWIDERGMMVFNLYDPADPLRSVDLFVEEPIGFDELWSRSVQVELPTGDVRVASIDDLIAMKRQAGRSVDSADIEALENLRHGNDQKAD